MLADVGNILFCRFDCVENEQTSSAYHLLFWSSYTRFPQKWSLPMTLITLVCSRKRLLTRRRCRWTQRCLVSPWNRIWESSSSYDVKTSGINEWQIRKQPNAIPRKNCCCIQLGEFTKIRWVDHSNMWTSPDLHVCIIIYICKSISIPYWPEHRHFKCHCQSFETSLEPIASRIF